MQSKPAGLEQGSGNVVVQVPKSHGSAALVIEPAVGGSAGPLLMPDRAGSGWVGLGEVSQHIGGSALACDVRVL